MGRRQQKRCKHPRKFLKTHVVEVQKNLIGTITCGDCYLCNLGYLGCCNHKVPRYQSIPYYKTQCFKCGFSGIPSYTISGAQRSFIMKDGKQ